jgi:hypothetical protein
MVAAHLPMLSQVYGLRRQDIYGDTTQPGLTLDEFLLYLEHHRRMAAEMERA